MAATASSGSGQSQGWARYHPHLSHECQEPTYLGHVVLLSRHICRKLDETQNPRDWNGAYDTGSQHQRQQFSLPSHASPRTAFISQPLHHPPASNVYLLSTCVFGYLLGLMRTITQKAVCLVYLPHSFKKKWRGKCKTSPSSGLHHKHPCFKQKTVFKITSDLEQGYQNKRSLNCAVATRKKTWTVVKETS